ncbi:MFS transporter, FHS family, L-fucose permease [Zunongwangia mangrovi]|uniref:MFS transporter, FHS family, L-fucose permease n=1 Tax=Zunongwangia mangrovi TaxID=1334022 RepID=A0A1I1JF62_9FLAO|nr:L-fucose:H+ symporter permease [Zunongwangia mangrovi]SFC44613.1 MFS transporter, FHS family, L-fucose permease [Zunongwangia mangrovi]
MSQASVVSKKVLLPFILVTSLFALWGFANDITNPMVSAFKKVLELDNFKASLVQLAFYGGYFTMALPAAIFVNRYSYKKGVLLGLALYALGALLFYPAASYEQFYFFLAALYILTFGLAFLETTANPYVLSMGDPKTATRRLNLAQAFNPMGALAGLIVAQNYILAALQSDDITESGALIYENLEEAERNAIRTADLAVIRDPYVILGFLVIVFFLVILFTKMPQNESQESKSKIGESIKRLFKNQKFVVGVIAQMFYVGAQIMVWTYLYQYAESIGISNTSAVNYGIAALLFFLLGRWIGTGMMKFIDSGKLLMYFAVGASICTLITIFFQGNIGLYALVGISLFMSIMFPTIYGVALDGLDKDAKFGAAFLVMAIVGGALMPTLQGLILDIGGTGYSDVLIFGVPEINFSFILPLICFLVVFYFGKMVTKF